MNPTLNIDENMENLQAIKRGYLIGYGNMLDGDAEKGFSVNKSLKINALSLLNHENEYFACGYKQGVDEALEGKENAYA